MLEIDIFKKVLPLDVLLMHFNARHLHIECWVPCYLYVVKVDKVES